MFMKKKIALLLSAISMVLVLGACGTDPTTVDYNGVTYDELKEEAEMNATFLAGASAEEILSFIETTEYLIENPSSNTYGIDPEFYNDLAYKWQDAMEVAGNYVEMVEDSFTVTKSGKTVTTDVTLKFEKRDVTFELVYNYYDMELTGVTVEPVYSLGEKMTTAALNTVICMSIVFAVLILISLIIYCFNIFPYLEQKKAEKAKAQTTMTATPVQTATPVAAPVATSVTPQYTNDTELVAVIAAAIAASTGTSTSDFVVRSIRRR